MTVRLSDSSCVPGLVDALLRSGCVPRTVDDATVEVIHPAANDAREARLELTFFLRAWQSRHPEVDLTFS